MDVLLAQAVFVAVFDERFGSVDHENTSAGSGVFLVQYQDTGRNAGAIEQVGRQADDALEDAGAHQLLANDRFRIAAKQNAVGQDAGGLATAAFHAADDVQHIGVITLLGGRRAPGKALEGVVFSVVAQRQPGAPGFVGEGWVGDHIVVGAQVFAIPELGVGQRVARQDGGSREVGKSGSRAGSCSSALGPPWLRLSPAPPV